MNALQPYHLVVLVFLLVLAAGVVCGIVWFVKRMNDIARHARASRDRRDGDDNGRPL